MVRALALLGLLAAAAAAACKDPARGTGDAGPTHRDDGAAADAAHDADATTDAMFDAMSDAAPDAPPLFSCATDTSIHFTVHPVGTGAIPDGRLIVVMYQFLENAHVPERVVYDVPFSGTSTTIDLALADLALPANLEDYKYCPRPCYDFTNPTCVCNAGQVNIALAFVFVMSDVDHSGAIEPAELVKENRYGVGVMQLGDSDAAYPPPTIFDGFMPDGIQGCLAPYSILPPVSSGIHDRLGIPAGTTFPLDVCVPGSADCSMLRIANLN